MTILTLTNEETLQVTPECSLERAIQIMDEHGLRHLPVVEYGKLVGIVSERDLLEATGGERRRLVDEQDRTAVVRDWMSLPVETLTPDEDLGSACARMLDRRIGALPLVGERGLSGMLTELDLLVAYARVCARPDVLAEFDPPVKDVMVRDLVTIDTDESAREAMRLLRSKEIRHLPAVHDGWFVGIVSDRDLRKCAGAGRLDDRAVRDVMSTDVATLSPGDPLSLAARLLAEERFGAAPVTDAKRLVGIVTTTDVLLWSSKLGWPESLDWLGSEAGF
jgi:CBS domain-containing protein